MTTPLRLLALAVPLLIASCSMPGLNGSAKLGANMLYHYNARLHLVIEHPSTWQTIEDNSPSDSLAPYTIHWISPQKKQHVPESQVTALSLPPRMSPAGTEGLLEEFKQRHPDLSLSPDESTPLPPGALTRYSGKNPSRECFVLFYEQPTRNASLSFCSSPESIQENTRLFDYMASTFKILD